MNVGIQNTFALIRHKHTHFSTTKHTHTLVKTHPFMRVRARVSTLVSIKRLMIQFCLHTTLILKHIKKKKKTPNIPISMSHTNTLTHNTH